MDSDDDYAKRNTTNFFPHPAPVHLPIMPLLWHTRRPNRRFFWGIPRVVQQLRSRRSFHLRGERFFRGRGKRSKTSSLLKMKKKQNQLQRTRSRLMTKKKKAKQRTNLFLKCFRLKRSWNVTVIKKIISSVRFAFL